MRQRAARWQAWRCCHGAAVLLWLLLAAPAWALPPEVESALQRARVPPDALSVLLQEAGSGRTVLTHQAQTPVNPASLAKLLTTLAALDQLGPAWSWTTPVWLLGPVNDGVLDGSLVIKGSGDPKLVIERVWLLLRQVQQRGVREIRGDIVLDRSAFAPNQGDAASFDGDTTRPYNVQPDALLLNFKSVTYTFVPDAARGVAQVLVDVPLAGARVERTVRLSAGPCDDWRSALKADFSDALRVRFAGSYPAACGELSWPVADADPGAIEGNRVATGAGALHLVRVQPEGKGPLAASDWLRGVRPEPAERMGEAL